MAGKIVVLGTGGTIAGTSEVAGANVGYTAAQLGVAQLLAAIPQLVAAAGGALEGEQVAQVDSKDMEHGIWAQLVRRCLVHLADDAVAGIVITHGTDTLEETAWLLHNVLPAHKPVVLTCAMRPATALAPDGPQNLLDAVALAARAGFGGVVAVAAGVVHGAREVTKVHPLRLDAFASGDGGPLGWMEEGQVRWAHGRAPQGAAPAFGALAHGLGEGMSWPRVPIVMSHAGVDGSVVQALVASGVDGLVAAATGNGTLHTALQTALAQAERAGVAVRVASRCTQGRMLAAPGDTWGNPLGLSPVKARISLMLELMGRRAGLAAATKTPRHSGA